jgi:hypothetical protein
MGELFPIMREDMARRGFWWWRAFMKLHHEALNLTTMRGRRNHFALDEAGVVKCTSRAVAHGMFGTPFDHFPQFVGASFTTDGHSARIHFITSAVSNPGPSGLLKLVERGYSQVRGREGGCNCNGGVRHVDGIVIAA